MRNTKAQQILNALRLKRAEIAQPLSENDYAQIAQEMGAAVWQVRNIAQTGEPRERRERCVRLDELEALVLAILATPEAKAILRRRKNRTPEDDL